MQRSIEARPSVIGNGMCTGPDKNKPLLIPVRRLILTPTGGSVLCDQRTPKGTCDVARNPRTLCPFKEITQTEIEAIDTTRKINTVLGELVYDPAKQLVSQWPGKLAIEPAHVLNSPILNGLLDALTSTPDTLVTHAELIAAMWPEGIDNLEGAKEVQIPKRIRELKEKLNLRDVHVGDKTIKIIESVREVPPNQGGYRLNTTQVS